MILVPDPFAVSAKGDDVKRPFGGGGIFSSSRVSGNRWGGKRSLTPWMMSKFALEDHETKRHQDSPHNDEEINYDFMKRPFGPRVWSRPSAGREEKRPFGGNMIFSKPRDAGAKTRFGGYLMSRVRREDSLGAEGTKLREISGHRKEKPHSGVFQKAFEELERDAWLEGLGRSGEGRKQHRRMSPTPYDDDYKDDEFDSNVREEEADDDKEGKEEDSRIHRL